MEGAPVFLSHVVRLFTMSERYRLTKRRMLEIEDYYGIEDLEGLEIWKGNTTFYPEKWFRLF